MGCGCAEPKAAAGKRTTFVVTKADGSTTEVDNEAAAAILARQSGGTYKKIG